MASGIYTIVNALTGAAYIGSSVATWALDSPSIGAS
jgi:hypothetical protein